MNTAHRSAVALLALMVAPGFAAEVVRVEGKHIRIEFDDTMHSRVVALLGGQKRAVGDFTPSESIRISGADIKDFSLQKQTHEPMRDRLGTGLRTTITGTASSLQTTVAVTVYDRFPRMAFFELEYTNMGTADLYPDFPEPGMPEFLMEKVPYVKLKGEWKGNPSQPRHKKEHQMPRYDHPAYQAAFRELNALLAADLNGSPQIEYMDTMMYGFWGEAHNWPFEGNNFPSNVVAEQTWMKMLETQLELWTKTPLVTNTELDFSWVGNSDLLDHTIRTNNWIRTDTIFIENTQIEALSNRPAWIAANCEVGMTTGDPQQMRMDEDVTYNEKITSHVLDVGANYWSVWNWHNEAAKNVLSYYEKYPEPIDNIAWHIGYRVYPSFIWSFERERTPGLVVGVANKGVAGVPGVLRLTVFSDDGKISVSGCVDPGYPKPVGIRQAMLMPAAGNRLERAEAESRTRGQGCTVSGELGVPPEDKSGWISDAPAQSAFVNAAMDSNA